MIKIKMVDKNIYIMTKQQKISAAIIAALIVLCVNHNDKFTDIYNNLVIRSGRGRIYV